ncbi:MAG: hypothetical protein EPO68_02580 [Planctomycetota bacterium]|nr:MAG: hypothetical protein EPO68_02580 [Planctomycetota bacterium]
MTTRSQRPAVLGLVAPTSPALRRVLALPARSLFPLVALLLILGTVWWGPWVTLALVALWWGVVKRIG